eukprot:11661179-Karenia_brevis.AAC.1
MGKKEAVITKMANKTMRALSVHHHAQELLTCHVTENVNVDGQLAKKTWDVKPKIQTCAL